MPADIAVKRYKIWKDAMLDHYGSMCPQPYVINNYFLKDQHQDFPGTFVGMETLLVMKAVINGIQAL